MARRATEHLILGTIRRKRSSLLHSTALQAATVAVFVTQAAAQPAPNARPTGGVVVGGTASITQPSTTLTAINQSTQRAAINWQSFDVGSRQTVQFNQPSNRSLTLNQVVGPDPSAIAGRITANGGIIITNQSGVVFHQGAQVDAASLVVSASRIRPENVPGFVAGGPMVFDVPPNRDAQVSNAGTITVQQAGLAALVAPRVVNSGVINARLGRAVLAGAEAHTIDLYGDGLLSFDVTKQVQQAPRGPDGKPVTALVTNTGTVIADGGVVQITAAAADGIVQNLVDAGGTIQANTAGGQPGQIAINGIGGSVRVAGRIAAEGGPGQRGGQIAVNATDTVAVVSGATVSANGHGGGGTVALGTTLARAAVGRTAALTRGARNPGVPADSARRVTVESGATVSANATGSGDGGTVVLLSTAETTTAGLLQARGGPDGGNGGAIEVSSLGLLTVPDSLDVSAPRGVGGGILYDPYDLLIRNDTTGSTSTTFPASVSGGTWSTHANTPPTTPGTFSVITPAQLRSASFQGATLIQLGASHDLTVVDAVNLQTGTSSGGGTGGASLSLHADHDLMVLNSITMGTNNPTLTLDAGHSIFVGLDNVGTLAPNPVTLTGSGPISISAKTTAPSATDLTAGSITISDGTHIVAGSGISSPGTLTMQALGSIGIGANAVLSGTGSLTATAGGDITVGANALLEASVPNTASTPTLALQAGRNVTIGSGATVLGLTQVAAAHFSQSGNVTIAGGSDAASVFGGGAGVLSGSVTVDGNISGGSVLVASGLQGQIVFDPGSFTSAAPLAGGSGSFNISGGNGGVQIGGTVEGGTGVTVNISAYNFSDGSSGLVTETSTGAVIADNLTGYAASYALTSSNNQIKAIGRDFFNTLAAVNGDVRITDSVSLAVGGTSTSTGGGISALDLQNNTPRTIELITDTLTIGPGRISPTPSSEGSVFSTLYTPGGTIAIRPFTPGRLVELVNGPPPSAGGALSFQQSEVQYTQADTLVLGSSGAGALTVGPANSTLTLGQTSTSGGSGFTELDLISGGAITQASGSALIIPTLTAHGATVTLANTGNQVSTLGSSSASTGDFSFTSGLSPLSLTGAISVPTGQTLTLSSNSLSYGAQASLSAPGGTVILGPSTPTAGFTLAAFVPLTPLVPITAARLQIGTASASGININNSFNFANVGLLDLRSSQSIAEFGGALLNTALTGQASSATLNGNNQLTILAGFAAPNGFALTNLRNLSVTGTVQGGSSIGITLSNANPAQGALTLQGDLDATAVTLNTTGAITQTSGRIVATSLGGGAGGATLNSTTNQVGFLDTFTSTGDFALSDASALTVAGTVSAATGGTLALTANSISFGAGAGLSAPGGTVALAPLTPGNPFALNSSLNTSIIDANTLQIGSLTTGPITIGGAFNLSGINTLKLLSASSVTEATGASLQVANLTGQAGSATLNGQNLIGTLGAFQTSTGFALTNAQSLTVNGAVQDGSTVTLTVTGDLALGANLTAPTALNLSATGAITQTAGILTTGLLTGTAGSAALSSAGNQVADLGPFTTTSSFLLRDGRSLAVVGAIDPPDITLNVSGDLTITQPITGNTVSLTATGAITESGQGRVSAATLTGGANSADLGGDNFVAQLAAFATHAGFTLLDRESLLVSGPVTDGSSVTIQTAAFEGTANLNVAGNVTAPDITFITGCGCSSSGGGAFTQSTGTISASATLNLQIIGSAQQTGGTISAGTLTGSSTGLTALPSGTNAITTLDSYSSSGGFSLRNSQGLTQTGALQDTSTITLNVAGPLALTGTVQAPLVTLNAPGNPITQSSGSIVATSLGGGAAGTTLSSTTNAVTFLETFTSTGDFALSDASALTVAGTVSAATGGTLALTANSISFGAGAGLSAPGGTVALAPLTPGNPFALNSSLNTSIIDANTLQIGSLTTGPITIGGAFNLSGINTLKLLSASSVTEATGASLQVANLTGQAGSATLNGQNLIGTLGAFQTSTGFALTNAQSLTVNGAVQDGSTVTLTVTGDLALGANLTAPTALSLSATGAITQTAGILTTGLLTGTAGSAALSSAGNQVADLGPFTTTSSFLLRDGRSLAVVGAIDPPDITLNVSGDLTITQPITGNTVSLTATGAITESGQGRVAAATLTGGANSANLSGANLIDTLGQFATAAGLSIVNHGPLSVAGPVTDDTAITLSTVVSGFSRGPITSTGTVRAPRVTFATGGSCSVSAGCFDFLQTGGSITATDTLTFQIGGTVAPNFDIPGSGTPSGAVRQAGGTITAGTLTGSSAQTTQLASSGNAVAVLGPYSSAGGFTLANGQGLTQSGLLKDTAAITVSVAGPLTLTGTVQAPLVTLNAPGNAITQPSGTILAATLTGSAAAAALSQGGNNVANLNAFTTTGDFSLADASNLAVTGPVTAGNSRTLSLQSDSITLAANGSLTAPSGTVALAPNTPGKAFELTSLVPTGTIIADTLRVGNLQSGAISINGPFALSGITTLDLRSGAGISENPGATIQVTNLTGQAASASIDQSGNQIAQLGQFATTGAFRLADQAPLSVNGPVTASTLTLNDSGNVQFNGNVGVGTLVVNAGGTITHNAGTITAGTLTGTAVGLAQFGGSGGTANVSTLGSMVLTGSTLSLTDSVPLTVTGPLVASTIAISAPNQLTLQGGQITSSNASFTAVGPGAQLTQTGVTTINPPGTGNAALTLSLPGNAGAVTLSQLNAGSSSLQLNLQNGIATGNLNVAGLSLNASAGSSNLFGSVAGVAGTQAAAISTIQPSVSASYLLNNCIIGAALCGGTPVVIPPVVTPPVVIPPVVIPPVVTPPVVISPVVTPPAPEAPIVLLTGLDFVPGLVPKSFFETTLGDQLRVNVFLDIITVGFGRDPTDPDLVLPNISDRDY